MRLVVGDANGCLVYLSVIKGSMMSGVSRGGSGAKLYSLSVARFWFDATDSYKYKGVCSSTGVTVWLLCNHVRSTS